MLLKVVVEGETYLSVGKKRTWSPLYDAELLVRSLTETTDGNTARLYSHLVGPLRGR